jgi:hypothetical protein
MAKVMDWGDAETKGGSSGEKGSLFLRLQEGKYRVRLISKPVRYLQHWDPIRAISPGEGEDGTIIDPLMALGHQPKPRFSIWVLDRDDENRLKIMDFPQSLCNVFSQWKQMHNGEPGGKEGPDFQISVIAPGGKNQYKKYEAMAFERIPFTEDELKRIKEGNLKDKILEYRRADTPEEIRAKLAEKNIAVPDSAGAPAAPAAEASAPTATEAPAPAAPAGGDDLDF